jgi:hypothetical protein
VVELVLLIGREAGRGAGRRRGRRLGPGGCTVARRWWGGAAPVEAREAAAETPLDGEELLVVLEHAAQSVRHTTAGKSPAGVRAARCPATPNIEFRLALDPAAVHR